jgi:hypothetical protein
MSISSEECLELIASCHLIQHKGRVVVIISAILGAIVMQTLLHWHCFHNIIIVMNINSSCAALVGSATEFNQKAESFSS